ncbi:MAG: hypothetical protein ACK5B9_04490 [Flavobacteriia bacterium]|jgi:hypothetical protein
MSEEQNVGNDNNAALSALAGFGALEKSTELREMVEKKFTPPTEENKETETSENVETTNTQTSENVETTDANTENVEQKTEEEDVSIESAIFGGKVSIKKEQKEEHETKIENLEEFNSHIKEQFGIEDISSLSKQIATWKEQEKTFGEASERLANAEKIFESMPSELFQLVQLHVNGADWKKGLTNPSLNFDKPLDDYNEKELVDVLFPDKVSKEEWEEYHDEDGDPKVKKMIGVLVDQAKEKFTGTKKQREELAKSAVENAKKQEEAFVKSVEQSSKKLSSQIEGIDGNYIKSIEKELKTPGGISKLFFEEDGKLKEDAALAFAMAKDGFGLLEQYKKLIARQTETKVNQDLLLRGSNTPTGSKGSQSGKTQEIRPEVQAQLDKIRGLAK